MQMFYKERLKIIREENEILQTQLAKKLNITKSAYCRYENELDIMPLKHLIATCDYLNVSIDYIFGFTNDGYKYENKEINTIESGKRLKELRKELKFTQDKLADNLNVARTIISKYEKGEYLIATHTLYDICKKYKISADYLLGRIDEPKYLK